MCHRIEYLLGKIPEELRDEANKLFSDMWDDMEDTSTSLGTLEAKIAGWWPTDHTGGKNLVRVGDELYEIHATKVEKNAKQEENRG
jgi:hypothetical protein